MAETIEKTVDSGKTLFDISVDTGQICMGFEADTPEKGQLQAFCMRLSDKDLVKKLLRSNRKIWLLVNNFLTKSLKIDMLLSFFRGICFKLHTNLTSINGKIQLSLT